MTAERVREHLAAPADPTAVPRFEAALRDLCGVENLWTVDSGRLALQIAVQAAGAGGGEVLLPSFICPAVADAVIDAGATPVLFDCDPASGNASVEDAERRITPRTRAIVVAHVFGNPARIEPFRELADRHGAALIEDCAHALGASVGGRTAGTFGDFSIFSFNFDKPITTGSGGALAVNGSKYVDAARKLVAGLRPSSDEEERTDVFGLLADVVVTSHEQFGNGVRRGVGRMWMLQRSPVSALHHADSGIDLVPALHDAVSSWMLRERAAFAWRRSLVGRIARRLSPRAIATAAPAEHPAPRRLGSRRAAIGIEMLSAFPETQARRNAIAERLRKAVAGSSAFAPVSVAQDAVPSWVRYAAIARDRHSGIEVVKRLNAAGIQSANFNWPIALHRLPEYRPFASDPDSLRNSEHVASHIINLPVHSGMSDDAVRTAAETLRGRSGGPRQ